MGFDKKCILATALFFLSASTNTVLAYDNLSIGAGSDGSSKASGTSYSRVRDGKMSTYWSPNGSTGVVSIKWSTVTTVASVIIKEAAGFEGNIDSWRLVNHKTGDVLASGSDVGTINFDPVSLKKINFEITGSSGTPAVAEFETYAGSTDTATTPGLTPEPTVDSSATTVSSAEELLAAIASAQAGSTIYIRGGTYYFGETITLDQKGNRSNTITLSKHPDDTERPLLDFSAMSENSSNRGLKLRGDYWHIYGIDVKKAGDNCLFISGSNNVVEFSTFSECADTGVQLGNGAGHNLIKNVDSYYNADSSLENADGFAAKLDVGDGNKFYGCRAWNNLDDGIDGYLRGANNVTTTYENTWVIRNGYLKDGSLGAGDGNGFKTGGSDTKDLKHNAVFINTIAAGNAVDGYDHNSNRGQVTIYNAIAHNNGRNINFSSSNQAEKLTIKNTISMGANDSLKASSTDIEANSWQGGRSATESDFVSVDIDELLKPRKADGSLPDVDYFKLVGGSDLIDAGVNVGQPYSGSAPDIGAFESGESTPTSIQAATQASKPEASQKRVDLQTVADSDSVRLSWTLAGITPRNQQIYRDTDPDPSGRVRIGITWSDTEFVDTNVTPGAIYYYWIKVVENDLTITNSSAASATIPNGVPTPAPTAAPTPAPKPTPKPTPDVSQKRVDLKAAADSNSVRLNWTLVGITPRNQQIYRDTDSDPRGRGRIGITWSDTEFVDTNVTPGTTYYYWIKVVGSDMTATNSSAISATIPNVTPTPAPTTVPTPAPTPAPTPNPSSCPVELTGWATVDGGTTGGGNAKPQRVTSMSELRSLAGDSTPRVLELSGTFNTGSSALAINSNKTLVGLGKDTTIRGGIKISGKRNIIVRNLSIIGAGSGGRPVDSVGVSGSQNLWFDHLNISDGPDGILDLTRGTDHVTVSWCKFWYTQPGHSHRLALLFGGGSTHGNTDTGKNNHTIHHNWFGELVKSRMPRLLFGKGHLYNNYYNSPGNNYCIGSGSWASLLVENNYFKDVNNPHRFQDSNPSTITAKGNIYDNARGKRDTGSNKSGAPAAWTNPPYNYTLDAARNVPELVKRCAGPQAN